MTKTISDKRFFMILSLTIVIVSTALQSLVFAEDEVPQSSNPIVQEAINRLWGVSKSKPQSPSCDHSLGDATGSGSPSVTPVAPPVTPGARLSIQNEISFHGSISPQAIEQRVESSALLSAIATAHWKISVYRSLMPEDMFTVITRQGMYPLLFEGVLLHPLEVSLSNGSFVLIGVTPEHRLLSFRPYEPLPGSSRQDQNLKGFYETQAIVFRTSSSSLTDNFYNDKFSADTFPQFSESRPTVIKDMGLVIHRSPNYVFALQIESPSGGFMRLLSPFALPGIASSELPRIASVDSNQLVIARASGETVFALSPTAVALQSTTEAPAPVIVHQPPPAERNVRSPRPRIERPGPTALFHADGDISVQELRRGGRRDLIVSILKNTETYEGIRAWFFLEPSSLFVVEANGIFSLLQVRTASSGAKTLMVRIGSLDEYSGVFTKTQAATFYRTIRQPYLQMLGRDLYLVIPSLNQLVIYKAAVGPGRYLKQIQLVDLSADAEETPVLYEIPDSQDLGLMIREQRYRLEIPANVSEKSWTLKGPLRGIMPSSWRNLGGRASE